MTLARSIPILHALAVCFAVNLATPAWAVDAERSAASLMSDKSVAYVELSQTKELLAHAMDNEFGKRIQAVPPLQQALHSTQFIQGRLILGLVEIGLGSTWRQLIEDFTEGGIYLAVEPKGNPVVLVNTKSGEWLEATRGKVMGLARGQAKRDGKPDPFKEFSHRDLKVYQAGDAWLGYVGDWLIVTQTEKTCHEVIDRFLDDATPTLAGNTRFQAARKNVPEGLAWGFVDVERLRGKGDQPQLKFTDNILAEILIGGFLDIVRNTPYATSSIQIEGRQLAWTVNSPFDNAWPGEDRQHFFGKDSRGQAPPRLEVKGHLATIAAYRDMSQAWLRSGDLMTDKATDQLAQADATLTTFFAGKDFGEDILSTFEPQVQLVVAQQEFSKLKFKPTIRLPAFALVSDLRDPEAMKPELRRLFLSFVGFLNVIGATEGNMQMDFDIEQEGETMLLSSAFVPIAGKDDQRADEAAIQFNFTPSVAFRGNRCVISSSRAFAAELATAEPVAQPAAANTAVAASGTGVGKILTENRESLISQNMLEDGHTRKEAEQQIDAILLIASTIRNADLQLVPGDGQISLRLEVELTEK
jgi:hypothetical protein